MLDALLLTYASEAADRILVPMSGQIFQLKFCHGRAFAVGASLMPAVDGPTTCVALSGAFKPVAKQPPADQTVCKFNN
jgi:hypothetical protein